MRTARVLFVLVVLLLSGALLVYAAPSKESGGTTVAPAKQLTITLMTDLSGPPTKPAVEDVITPVLRQKTGVTVNVIPEPKIGADHGPIVQALVAGNNLPDIITESYIPPNVAAQQVLVEANAVWDFSDIPTLRKLFPYFTSRIDQWGDLNVWYDNERTFGDTHIRITQNIPTQALTKLVAATKGTTFYRKQINIGWPYRKYLRDDILRKIYPTARTDAQQEEFYVKTFNFDNPTGASDPYADIPIKSMDDLYNYLKKVKEIIDRENLKDGSGRDKMVVAQLNYMNSNPPSIMWSNITMYGYWWTEPPFRVADKVYYNFQEPWVKTALQWWNKLYSEGLLDPELFVKNDDQMWAEIVRGRFAVFPNWASLGPDARKYAKENNLGYGLRELPNWWPVTFKNTYNDASNQWVTYFQHFGANIITKNVKEADLPQVAGWLDYHYSEEFDILKSWGPSSFYTGTGKDRRYKPEYKDLENFQVNGQTGGKDGYYYGIMANSPVTLESGTWNYEIQTGCFAPYHLAPQYVYPQVKKAGQNFEFEMLDAVRAYYTERMVNFFPQVGWTNNELNSLPNFSKIQYGWFGTHGPAMAKAITDKPANFEANWAAYQKVFTDNEYAAGMQEYQAKWKEIFDKNIKQYWK